MVPILLAQKSLNHGFMDEAYENRPEAKNSASTAASIAGVRMRDSKVGINEEEAAFLKSVKGKANQYSENVDDRKRDQIIPPPPQVPKHDTSSLMTMQSNTSRLKGCRGLVLYVRSEFGRENTSGFSSLVPAVTVAPTEIAA